MRRPGSALGWLLAATLAACSRGTGASRPSVVLISIDTLRADHVGTYGYARDTTPFLDRFARRAVVFERAFTPAAWTLSAHMSMLTGLYPEQHGVLEGDLALAPEVPLLAEHLARSGYHTIGLYQPTWVHPRHGFDRGFEVFRAHERAEQAGEHLFEELARVSAERPFFLFVHLFDVHSDPADRGTLYSAPEPFRELYVPGAAERLTGVTYLGLKHGQPLAEELKTDMVALYDEGIRHVDALLGQWLTRMEAEGHLANTLVIVTSDHGESLGQRGPLGGHGGIRQEGVHVPLIVRLPGDARGGTRVRESAHLIDVLPTVLDFVGLPRDPRLPGLSLLGPLPPERLLAGSNPPLGYVVRWPDKWLRWSGVVRQVDLDADPGETSSARTGLEAYEAARRGLALAPGTVHAGVPIDAMSPADVEALRALGYGGELEEK
jgi:arylsulfatase A-like enzyme